MPLLVEIMLVVYSIGITACTIHLLKQRDGVYPWQSRKPKPVPCICGSRLMRADGTIMHVSGCPRWAP